MVGFQGKSDEGRGQCRPPQWPRESQGFRVKIHNYNPKIHINNNVLARPMNATIHAGFWVAREPNQNQTPEVANVKTREIRHSTKIKILIKKNQ